MLYLSSVIVVSKDQVSADLDGEVVVLNLESGTYYGLYKVGAFVWKLIQRPRSLRELRDAVLTEYDVDSEQCERDLMEWVDELLAEGLAEVEDETTP